MNTANHLLQIDVHKVDGSVETFFQNDERLAKHILGEFQPGRIFTRDRIILAGDQSLTFFPVGQVARMDLVSEQLSRWMLPPGIVDAVELTGPEFQELLRNPKLYERQDAVWTREASVIVFLDIEVAGQPRLFLVMEAAEEPLADPLEAILSLFNAPALCFRMRPGGLAALNLFHLVRYTLFPGPRLLPVEAWPAHQAKGPQLKQPDRDFRGTMDEKPAHSNLPQDGPMNFDPPTRSQNEDEPTMERKYQ